MTEPITAPTPQAVPAASKGERRASVRLQSNAKGSCQSLSMQRETHWEATVRDISCQGIGLLLTRRFEPGALLAIELTEANEERKRLLLVRVARAVPQPEGRWLIGCTLANPLTEDEVRLLLGESS
ncbi:MAG TPA: PilZ domain-containing protein [Gemmataceae bacterium]|nr:PilZ domain-containing protein [Gemmataceae bacterium]